MSELEERVIEALQEITDDGESYTFKGLCERVVPPGECVECQKAPILRVVRKLVASGRILMSLAD